MDPENIVPQDEATGEAVVLDPQQTDVVTAPVAQDPATELAIERAKSEAYREALSLGGHRTQDAATGPPPVQKLPESPMDMLTEAQQNALANLQLTDPQAYARQIGDLTSRFARAKMAEEAAPLVNSQARLLVESFVGRQYRTDPQNAPAIEAIFTKSIAGLDLRPLVNMSDAARDSELTMRWNAAASGVYRKAMSAPRAEPRLTVNDGPGGASLKKPKIAEDPFMSRMATTYNFTPEQLAEIEAANV